MQADHATTRQRCPKLQGDYNNKSDLEETYIFLKNSIILTYILTYYRLKFKCFKKMITSKHFDAPEIKRKKIRNSKT